MTETLKIPVGEQGFNVLREDGYLYIDKTAFILRMIQSGSSYFLNRPRRMGKSLLLSTLQALFQGRRELFEGLAIAKAGYDFKPYPVIRLDFGNVATRSYELCMSGMCKALQHIATQAGIDNLETTTPDEMLGDLIKTLATRGPVVLLIDEYDRPIHSNLKNHKDISLYLDFFKDFYANIKSLYPYLRFTFITGVSRFAKTTLFSGMNNLDDLSLEAEYAALLGVTDDEISCYLQPFVLRMAQDRQQPEQEIRDLMRQWYNGYRFAGDAKAPAVYNPFSLLSFLKKRQLANYWFDTGTPSFVLQLLRKQSMEIIDLERGVRMAQSDLTANIDSEHIDIYALLFQTGYLTIGDYDQMTNEYILRFPNHEVRKSFFEHLVALLFNINTREARMRMQAIAHGLRLGNAGPIITAFNDMLGQLPYYLLRREESYYHSIFLTMLIDLGLDIEAEKSCCTGRMDLSLRYGNKVYIFELKRDHNAADALRQIHEQQYARAYAGKGLEIYLVGININSALCAVDDWQIERQ